MTGLGAGADEKKTGKISKRTSLGHPSVVFKSEDQDMELETANLVSEKQTGKDDFFFQEVFVHLTLSVT